MLDLIQKIIIDNSTDMLVAKQSVREISQKIGFNNVQSEEICIVSNELTSNILKYGSRGFIIISKVIETEKVGISLVAEDFGPGIDNIQVVMQDSYSTKGTLGIGLGSINRLVDELYFTPAKEHHGTEIHTIKWIYPPKNEHFLCPFDIGTSIRMHSLGNICGDAYIVKIWEHYCLMGIIDGLGHGEKAKIATRSAQMYIESHYRSPLKEIFTGVDRVCIGTRGIVLGLLSIDWINHQIQYGIVGNIGLKSFPLKKDIILRRGVLGLNAPSPIISELPWDQNQIFVLFSDGIKSHFQYEDFESIKNSTSNDIAFYLMRKFNRNTDDATILVMKWKNT